jgi:hypothetical protein
MFTKIRPYFILNYLILLVKILQYISLKYLINQLNRY